MINFQTGKSTHAEREIYATEKVIRTAVGISAGALGDLFEVPTETLQNVFWNEGDSEQGEKSRSYIPTVCFHSALK